MQTKELPICWIENDNTLNEREDFNHLKAASNCPYKNMVREHWTPKSWREKQLCSHPSAQPERNLPLHETLGGIPPYKDFCEPFNIQ